MNLFSSEATVVRPLLTCVSHLIAAQQIPTWSSAELNAIYQALLFRLIDERPKVRKVSQAGVMLILGKSAELTLKSPPSCSILLRFITHLLKDAQKSSIKDSEWSSVLHLLGFLKENLHQIVISAKNGKALEPLLSQLLTIPLHKNTHATILAFDAISTFFQQACIPQTLDLPISFEKVNKWIIDICSMKPNINNFDLLPIFFDALVNACVYFGKLVVENQGNESYLISQSCFKTQLKLTFDTLFDMWQSTIHSKDHVKKTHDFIGNSLTKLVTGTISLEMIKETLLPYSVEWKRSEDLASEHPETEFELVINRISKERTVVEHIAHQISGPGLSLTFQAAWGSLLSFSCHFFTHIHNIHVKHIHDSSAPLIQPSEPFVNVFISPVVVLASEMIHRLCDDQIVTFCSYFKVIFLVYGKFSFLCS